MGQNRHNFVNYSFVSYNIKVFKQIFTNILIGAGYTPARPIETGCNNMQAQLYPFRFSSQPSSSLFMGLSAQAGGLVAPQPDLSGGEQLI